MKLEAIAASLATYPLACPCCTGTLKLVSGSLICPLGHCYDISAKGYVNLAPTRSQLGEKYDTSLFECRRGVLDSGFYQPVLSTVESALRTRFGDKPFALLDAGCGEGYYTRSLATLFPNASVIGADLSRDAIVYAARGGHGVAWLVADLKRLPVRERSLDVVLNVLTPADYTEFERVTKPEGELIKVIPGEEYLCEVRRAVAPYLRHEEYDNERVLSHLREHADIISQEAVHRTFSLTEEQSRWFLGMTPMTFSVPKDVLKALSLSTITIHLVILRCKIRNGMKQSI